MAEGEGSVVFTDLVGFTEYTAHCGDAEALRILAAQDEIVRPCLPADARIVKEIGDGLMLWFPDPCASVVTMLDVLDGFASASDSDVMPLWVRIGAHWGARRAGETTSSVTMPTWPLGSSTSRRRASSW